MIKDNNRTHERIGKQWSNIQIWSRQTRIKRLIAFRDSAPNGGVSGMPCGACREFLYQLNEENENMEIMVDYEKRETVTLK